MHEDLSGSGDPVFGVPPPLHMGDPGLAGAALYDPTVSVGGMPLALGMSMGLPLLGPGSELIEQEAIDISDMPLQLKPGMRFNTWAKFEVWFKRYCAETHQAFSTAYSRSVDYANHRMAMNSLRYRPELCYTYIMLTCIRSGTKQLKKGFEAERHRSHSKYLASRIECPAFIQISGQKVSDTEQYLVVKRIVLEHNHPCQSGHFHFYPQIQFALNADENLVMLDLLQEFESTQNPMPGKEIVLVCRFCKEVFSQHHLRLRHIMSLHFDKFILHGDPSGGVWCCESTCRARFFRVEQLRQHLEAVHEHPASFASFRFASYEDFYSWKAMQEQNQEESVFVTYAICTDEVTGRLQKVYMYCNHPRGKVPSIQETVELSKASPATQTGFNCTATMVLNIPEESTELEVEYCATHYAHEPDAGGCLSPYQRAKLARITEGQAAEKRFPNIPKPGRFDLLTMKELNRLARKWGLYAPGTEPDPGMLGESEEYSILNEQGQPAPNGPPRIGMVRTFKHRFSGRTAVPLRVRAVSDPQTLLRPEPNPLLFVKLAAQPVPPQCGFLGPNDTLVIIQTVSQKEAMVSFSPMRGVCIDVSTEPSNSYWVVSVLVLSEHYDVLPVAFCLTNEITVEALRLYYQVLQQNIGAVVLNVPFVLTDENEAFWSTWCEVFGDTSRLIADWYLQKAWSARLQLLYPENGAVVASLLDALNSLLDEKDADTFVSQLLKFVTVTGENEVTQLFSNEFANSYYLCTGAWAKCYRSQCGTFTGMHVEAFGNELKSGHFIRTNLTPDFNLAIRSLSKFAHLMLKKRDDKLALNARPGYFDADVKVNIADERISLIMQSHEVAETQLEGYALTPSNENPQLFTLQSPDKSVAFTIKKLSDACPERCLLRCRDCRICVHSYECNCPEYVHYSTICRHIHVVHKYTAPAPNPSQLEFEDAFGGLDIKRLIAPPKRPPPPLGKYKSLSYYPPNSATLSTLSQLAGFKKEYSLSASGSSQDIIKVLPRGSSGASSSKRQLQVDYELEEGELDDSDEDFDEAEQYQELEDPLSVMEPKLEAEPITDESDIQVASFSARPLFGKRPLHTLAPSLSLAHAITEPAASDNPQRTLIKKTRLLTSIQTAEAPSEASSSRPARSVLTYAPIGGSTASSSKSPPSRILVVYPVEQTHSAGDTSGGTSSMSYVMQPELFGPEVETTVEGEGDYATYSSVTLGEGLLESEAQEIAVGVTGEEVAAGLVVTGPEEEAIALTVVGNETETDAEWDQGPLGTLSPH